MARYVKLKGFKGDKEAQAKLEEVLARSRGRLNQVDNAIRQVLPDCGSAQAIILRNFLKEAAEREIQRMENELQKQLSRFKTKGSR
jgi:hypothetical protein